MRRPLAVGCKESVQKAMEMERFVLTVLVFYAVFAAADGIKCYVCTGTEDDCAKDTLEANKAKYLTTCSFLFDRCIRVWAKKDSITTVVNACSNKAVCDATKKACDNTTDGQCAVSCCTTDECNAGSAGVPTDGIKCYACSGTEDVCAKDTLEANKDKYLTTCSSLSDRCIRVWAKKDSITTVANACSNKAICDATKKLCDDTTDGQCDVSCCTTDECNAGSAGVPTDGIKCYVCTSRELEEDDCAKDTLEANKAKYLKTCPSSSDRCVRVWAKFKKDNNTIVRIVHQCASKAECDSAKEGCDDFKEGQCDVSCCQTDECNAGSTADGIKCYNCLGTKDTCAKDKLKKDKATYVKTCPKQLDRCLLYWTIKDDQDVAMSSCADKALCDAKKKACKDSAVCGASCCFTDECNVGSSVSFSGFVMTVCSILGLALFNQATLP